MSYLLGYDIGSSSVKASLLEAETGVIVAAAASPRTEMEISSPHPGWAEQHPDTWWEHVRRATAIIKAQAGAKQGRKNPHQNGAEPNPLLLEIDGEKLQARVGDGEEGHRQRFHGTE